MLHLAGCKDNHFATISKTFLEKSHLFMRESAGARVVRALCAWYGRAMRARAKVRWRATASQPHLSVSALATRGSQGANVRGLGGGRSERGNEERADRTESTQASLCEPTGEGQRAEHTREREEATERADRASPEGTASGSPQPPQGAPHPSRQQKTPPQGTTQGHLRCSGQKSHCRTTLRQRAPLGAEPNVYGCKASRDDGFTSV